MYYGIFIICNNCFYSSDLCKESKSSKKIITRSARSTIKDIFCREDANRPNKKERRQNLRRSRISCCFLKRLRIPTCFGREKESTDNQNDSVCHDSHPTSEDCKKNSLPLSEYTCGRLVQFLSEGTRVVKITTPPNKPYGFFIAQRKVGNNKGGFCSGKRLWIHLPEVLKGGHVAYFVKFTHNVKKSVGGKIQRVELTISVDVVAVQDFKTKEIFYQYPLHQISYCANDNANKRFISIVAQEETGKYSCLVCFSNKQK
ncbi:uncharacterized protein LOC143232076 isoform X2 [Tachypleus tridentatus]|uniref:uncharacterized protein LOC143232076 isoform X2 n=1 Tax=Tachypleus tridentatus TaxID=6853 RepID=UPI003FD2BE56